MVFFQDNLCDRASANYGKVEITLLNYMNGFYFFPQISQTFHFVRV